MTDTEAMTETGEQAAPAEPTAAEEAAPAEPTAAEEAAPAEPTAAPTAPAAPTEPEAPAEGEDGQMTITINVDVTGPGAENVDVVVSGPGE
jgi:hypothetical protein